MVKFVADVSSPAFRVNSLLCRKRSECCVRFVVQVPQESLISVSAADPLNLVGIIVPGSRITAHTSNRILYQDGAPIASFESGETHFLVELSRTMEWKAKAALMRKATRPELRSYFQRPA